MHVNESRIVVTVGRGKSPCAASGFHGQQHPHIMVALGLAQTGVNLGFDFGGYHFDILSGNSYQSVLDIRFQLRSVG